MTKQRLRVRSLIVNINKLKIIKRREKNFTAESSDFYKLSEDEIGTENEYLKTYLKQNSYRKNSRTRFLMSFRRKLRSAKNDILFMGNIIRDWLGYTFCCVMRERKKQKGVLKSAKI